MKNKSKSKRYTGTIISIIVHLLVLFLLFRNFRNNITFDPNLFRPTSTVGYQVELVHTDSDDKPQEVQAPTPPAAKPVVDTQQQKADVNIKQVTPAKPSQSKEAKPKPQKQKAQIVKTKKVKAQKAKSLNVTNTADRNQDGVVMTDKNQDNIIASAPHAQDNKNQVGDGGAVNSSTNGMGTQTGTFDFRVIQYGRDAADAIKQNIVVPPNLANKYFTYRAFVRLNQNMGYESMALVKSTGNADLDRSIAKALRQTIYPPLPPGANFDQYKNIDFTIQ